MHVLHAEICPVQELTMEEILYSIHSSEQYPLIPIQESY